MCTVLMAVKNATIGKLHGEKICFESRSVSTYETARAWLYSSAWENRSLKKWLKTTKQMISVESWSIILFLNVWLSHQDYLLDTLASNSEYRSHSSRIYFQIFFWSRDGHVTIKYIVAVSLIKSFSRFFPGKYLMDESLLKADP